MSFLNIKTSQTCGNLSKIPSAVLRINASLSLSLPEAAAVDYIKIRFSHKDLAELVKYVISALGCKPKTEGEFMIGISLIQFENPS